MNIFYLDHDPYKAASYFYDKHKVKMILESAQMLCTAHHVYGDPNDVPYRQAHLNHPSTIWARESRPNYFWLYEHMIALGQEYTKRYGKIHMTIDKCRYALSFCPDGITSETFTEPPQCMPDEYKVEGDSISAYWNYYEQEKHLVRNKNEQKIIRPHSVSELYEHSA
jgi:hypothetical protein